MNTSWHSYPSIYALGHKALQELFSEDVVVEEKIDGSQFSFGRFDGELKVRSKGATINAEYPEKMFSEAVEVVKAMELKEARTKRAEYLKKPKHNTLAYDRVPEKHLILFDINTGEEVYLDPATKRIEAERIGLEVVPIFFNGKIDSSETLLDFLERQSILGGQKIEGFVVKNYNRFGPDKKALMGKYVSEAFKEVHGGEWRKNNPTTGDVIATAILRYRTPARWEKAVQHLRDRGELTQSPRDIGALIKEVQEDIEKECAEEIKQMLYDHAIKNIRRAVTGGLPEWYKQELLKLQFNNEVATKPLENIP